MSPSWFSLSKAPAFRQILRCVLENYNDWDDEPPCLLTNFLPPPGFFFIAARTFACHHFFSREQQISDFFTDAMDGCITNYTRFDTFTIIKMYTTARGMSRARQIGISGKLSILLSTDASSSIQRGHSPHVHPFSHLSSPRQHSPNPV